MILLKKSDLNASEVARIRKHLNGYIWAVLDTKRNTIALGDEYLIDMRDLLIYRYHSCVDNLFGIGLDLKTGEIYYPPVVNRMNRLYRKNKGILPDDIYDRIETMVSYYFEKFQPFFSRE